jgi:hypothetical protein
MDPKDFMGELNKKLTSHKDELQKNYDEVKNELHEIQAQAGRIPGGNNAPKTFEQTIAGIIKDNFSEIKAGEEQKRNVNFRTKTVGDMTVSANLSGDGTFSYNPRQGIVPSPEWNFRDIISTTFSPTGLFVSYRETGGEGSFTNQTPGSSKSQVDYDFTSVNLSSSFLAGYATFARQMAANLPWLQSTLPRLLLRSFFEAENADFYNTAIAGASGYTASSETDHIEKLIDILAGRLNQKFQNSYVIVSHQEIGRLLKLLYTTGNYFGSGSIVGTPEGSIRIMGTPIIGASWALDGRALIIDRDYIERVETEQLRVDFSFENASNFIQNKVTVRVECYEALNLLRADAHSFFQFS